jgi:hypothetical protein
VILLAAAVALAPATMARFGFRGFVAMYVFGTLAWLPLVRRSLPLAITIAIGVALRLLLLFHEPLLSGDVYRYLSDGRVSASGGNPYAYTPTDARINHPEIRSIYPPLAQLLFRVVHQLTVWRLLLVAADLAATVLLRRDGALAYATCPLVLFEGTWSAHIDLLAGVLLAFALARRSMLAAGLAGGLKVIPLAALFALLRTPQPPSAPSPLRGGEKAVSRRRMRGGALITLSATLIAPILPFLGSPIMPGFRDYATRWIFNSPLYDVVRAIVERIPTKEIWTHHPLRFQFLSDVVYRHVYADFLTRAMLAVLAIGAILLARRVTTAVAALLICSPAIHPWYWLTIVPAALLERSRWLYVALLMPLSYLLYDGVPAWMVYGLYVTSALSALVIRRVRPTRGDSPS